MELYHCSVADLHRHVPAGSVDAIVTDPPYPREFLSCYADLRDFAVHALRPSGHLLAMSGHAWLREVMNLLHCDDDAIRYQWMLAMSPMSPSATNIGRRIKRIRWKPILWYVKPPSDIHVQMNDVIPMNGDQRDKRYHHWGQGVGVFDYMLHQIHAGEGTVICDPFLGGGTTAVAAVDKGCRFIGADIDETCIQTTRERLMTRQLILPEVI